MAPVLSDDGEWVGYTLRAATGHRELIVRATQGQKEFRTLRGFVPGTPSPQDADAFSTLNEPAEFTADNRFALFSIIHSEEETKTAVRGNSADRWTAGFAILDLHSGNITKIRRGTSFVLPKEVGRYVAYRLYDNPEDAKSRKMSSVGRLAVRDLTTNNVVHIPDVTEFVLDDHARYVAYIVESETAERNGVYVYWLRDSRVTAVLAGPGRYRNIALDGSGSQLVFLSTHGSSPRGSQAYSLYYATAPSWSASSAVPATTLEEGWTISPNDKVAFTQVARAVTFKVVRTQSAATTSPAYTPGAKFELWHWKEPAPLPQGQWDNSSIVLTEWKTTASYLAVYQIAPRRWAQLADETMPKVLLTDNGRYGIGFRTNRRESSWAHWSADIFLVDGLSGKARKVRRLSRPIAQHPRFICEVRNECLYVTLSPGGRYAVYFENRRWWSLELETGNIVDMTGKLLAQGIHFDISSAGTSGMRASHSQDVDYPSEPVAGWTAGDRRVVLYDHYDIWEVDPAGKAVPRNLTDGAGRRDNNVFRLYEDFDLALSTVYQSTKALPRSSLFLDTAAPLLLMGVDQGTQASGIWRIRQDGSPANLMKIDKRIAPVAKSKNRQQHLLTIETFREYPDLWTGSNFERLTRISDANPQQREYRWGTAELVDFTSDWGVPLKGILYKPDDFDPSRKYPMIVSIYQMNRSMLHKHAAPSSLPASPGATAGWPTAVSRGYIWFVPDVLTAAPYPGPSAVAAVVPAVQSILERGFVDPARIALTGHSFGAFEANYVLTQSNMFRCAISDAGATDLLSFYATDVFGSQILERGQFVLGGSVWDRPFIYITNSAIFYADRVRTPLLMMHNDGDRHPPLSQGMEFFAALRRNHKEVYLFNYHGESHGLFENANRLDWDSRAQEFLDYFLKDAPRPGWMDWPNVGDNAPASSHIQSTKALAECHSGGDGAAHAPEFVK